MCNNIIVLGIFIFLKVVAVIILPIIIFVKRKKQYAKIILIIDLLLLAFFLICNVFTINKCVYNSSIEGFKRITNEKNINLYSKTDEHLNLNSSDIKPSKNYKTFSGKDLYYFNQNRDYMKDLYLECDGNNIYINSFGSGITAFSTVISTLYQKNISPVEVFKIYKNTNINSCNKKITLEDIYNSTMQKYGGITMQEIDRSQITAALRNDDLVIAELLANEDSKLTCDSGYVIIYTIMVLNL